MSVTDLPAAGESPPVAMGATPPDQESWTLRDCYSRALAIIGRDEQLTPDEQFELRAHLEGVLGIGRSRQQAGQPPLGAPQQQGAPDQANEGPYMGHAGTMSPNGV
jgi:hypothetical protein